MVKSREFHSQILKRGKKRGWHWIKGEGDGSHRIYEDKNGIRYPVPYHGAKEMGEGLRKKIIRDLELEEAPPFLYMFERRILLWENLK